MSSATWIIVPLTILIIQPYLSESYYLGDRMYPSEFQPEVDPFRRNLEWEDQQGGVPMGRMQGVNQPGMNIYPAQDQPNIYRTMQAQPENNPSQAQGGNGNGYTAEDLKNSFWNKLNGYKDRFASKFKGVCKKFTHLYENGQSYLDHLYDEADKHKDQQAKKDNEEIEKCRATSPNEMVFKQCVDKYEETKRMFTREKVQEYMAKAKETLKPLYGIAVKCANAA